MTTIEQFLRDIAKHCSKHEISKSSFGRKALNDPNFVSDVEKGRSPTNALMQRVYKYMREQK